MTRPGRAEIVRAVDEPVSFQRLQVALGVRDVGRSVAFYGRHFGFELISAMGDDFALLGRDGVTLALVSTSRPAVADFVSCYVYVSDVEAAREACIHSQLTPVGPLTTHPWGNRDFVVRDPDGHQLAFGQSTKVVS